MAIDLTVLSISWSPSTVNVGDPVIFSAVVRNTGTTATPAGVRHTVLFSVDGASQTWSDNTTASHASLTNKTYTASGGITSSAWTATAGTHTVTAFVDDENLITESNETNNELSVEITVLSGGGGGGGGVDFPLGNAVIANGRVEVGGVPYFPNGFFLVDRGESTTFLRDTLTMLANAGFNFVHAGMPGGSETGPFLDLAESLGLKIIEEGMSAGEMATFSSHNAMLGHNIGDDVHAFDSPATVLARHNTCKANDPGHITYFSDYGGSAEQSPFVGIGDVAGPYDYPVNTNGALSEVNFYINQIRLIRAPIFGIPQTFNWSPEAPSLGTRVPNAKEYRNMTYQYIINKCMGLINYDITDNVGFQRLDTKEPALWAECVIVGAEIKQLSDMLLTGTYAKLTTNNGVLGARWVYQGGFYVILVNPESNSRACTFTMPSTGTLTNVFSSRPAGLTLVGTTLSGTIATQDVHIYTTVTEVTQEYDLTVTDITWSPANPIAGNAVTFSATISNTGNIPTPAGTIHEIGFYVDDVLVTWSNNNTTSLANGTSRSQTANGGTAGATWTATAGAHNIRAWVDSAGRFTESSTANNQLTEVLTVSGAVTRSVVTSANAAVKGRRLAVSFHDLVVGAVVAPPPGIADQAKLTNFSCLLLLGPNEIDAWTNARIYYLADAEAALPAYSVAARADVANLSGAAGLNTLLLRIYDHQRHMFEWAREKRPDVGCIAPSLIQVAASSGTREFNIYDFLRFTHSGAGLTAQGCINDVCDAHQVHLPQKQWNIPNPWTGGVPAASDITPYHYWKACEEVRTWRAANGGLADNTRPLIASEVGIDFTAQNSSGRTDALQLRRLKYGMMTLGPLYYGCSLVNFYAAGGATPSGFNVIDSDAVTAGQVAFVGAGAVAGSAANGTLTPLLPAGIQQNDLLLCVAYSRTSTGTHTSQWTNHFTMDTGPHYLSASYKIAAGSGIDSPPVITPSGLAADQSSVACIIAFRGVDPVNPLGTPGANSTNAVAEDIGPISPATALVTNGAAVVIGCRNATSAGGNVSVLTGDGLTWSEAADGGFTTGFGCQMAVDYATWGDTIPTLTAKTFNVAAGLTGAGCGKMLLVRPAVGSGGGSGSGFYGSAGERDADFAFAALDVREANDLIPFTAKTWRDYWREWQVACDVIQDPIDGDNSVCPFTEWNRVTMSGGTIAMAAGGRNIVARKKNLRRGTHTFSCELRLSAGARACLRVSGHDKLNGLSLVSSAVLTGSVDWTRVSVSFAPRQHNNPRVPDPRYAVLMIDHDGIGTCEARSPTFSYGGTVIPEEPPPTPTFFDLQVIDIGWSPAAPVAGEAVTFNATIFNNGDAPSPSGIIHGVRFDVDGAMVAWSDNITASIPAHGQRVQTANGGPGGVATWTAVAGTHTVQAYVDDMNRMPTESDNANNILTKNIIVAAPPSGIAPPPQAAAANLTTLAWNDEFEGPISFYHPTATGTVNALAYSPSGRWRHASYGDALHAGYIDFAANRTYDVNPLTTHPATTAYPPLSKLDTTTMRIKARRIPTTDSALLNLVRAQATSQGQNPDNISWLGALIRTTTATDAYDIFRPVFIECRCRVAPTQQGFGGAWWLFAGADPKQFAEIDMIDMVGNLNYGWYTHYHMKDNNQQGPSAEQEYLIGSFPLADAFHTYGLHWTDSFIRMYRDGVLIDEQTGSVAAYYNTPLRMYFSIAGWVSVAPLSGTNEFNIDVDFVRVWKPGASTARVFPATGTLASAYTVTAGGQNSPVYPVTVNTWYRNNPNTPAPGATEQERWAVMHPVNETAGFTAFEMAGASAVPVSVRFNDRTVTSAKVYPVRHNITPTISGGNTVNFSVPKDGKYIVMINGTEVRPCHVFVHSIDNTAPTASGTGVVYYGPGTHNVGTITVANNTTYYIAGGARVVGNFNVANKTGFKIKGRGIVQSASNFLIGDGASNFTVEGVTIIRPLGSTADWTFKQRNATGFTVDGVNVFSCEVTRDGIDSVSCRDYTIKNSFARTMDDPCCINAAFAGLGNIENAVIEDCVFMPDTGIGGLEIGASMECTYARNITYRRIDMVNPRIQCAISILNSDYCDVNNVVYDDIHVDGFRGSVATGSCWLGRFEARQTSFSATPYSPGQIRNIDLYNVKTINTPSALRKFLYQGNTTYSVGPIRWHNLNVDGVAVTSESQITVSKPADVGSVTYDALTRPDETGGLVMVTNRAHMANVGQSSGANRNVAWRTAFWATASGLVTEMRLVFSNTYLTQDGEFNGLNTIFVTAAIEYNGAFATVSFNGSREVQVAAGATVTSDPVPITVPANAQFWTRQNVRTANATEKFPTGYLTRADFGEGGSSTNAAAKVDAIGVLADSTQDYCFAPVAIIGVTSDQFPATASVIGSSSAFGANENYNIAAAPGNRGYTAHRLSTNVCHNIIATGGTRLQHWVASSSRRMAIIAAARPKYVVNQLGEEDILAGRTSAQVIADLQTLWTQLSQAGYLVIQQTFTPTSTSTDGWTTVNGQTPTFQAARNAVNAHIRTKPAPLTDIMDVCAVIESTAGSGRWRVDGGAWTNDGKYVVKHTQTANLLSLAPFGKGTPTAVATYAKRGMVMNIDSDFSAGTYWDVAIAAMNTLGVDYTREAMYNCGTFSAGSTTFTPYSNPWVDTLRSRLTAANKGCALAAIFTSADNGNPDNYGPLHRQRVASVSTWAANRYGTWALWFLGRNEPEIQVNWVNLSIEDCAQRIVAEQKAFYDAVKAVNPSIMIEGPPMVTHPYNYGDDTTAFRRSATISYRIMELGITRYMDVFGFHASTGATEDLDANGNLRVTYHGQYWISQRAACGPNGWPYVPAQDTEWNSPQQSKPASYTAMTVAQWQAEVHHLKFIMYLFVGLQNQIQYCFARSAAGVDFGIAEADGITPREPVYSRTRDYIRHDKYSIDNFTGRFNQQVSINGWNKTYPWMVVWEVLNPVTASVNGLPRQWSLVTWNATGGTALGYSTNDYAAVGVSGATMIRQPVTKLLTDGTAYTITARVKLLSSGTARLRAAGHVRLPIVAGSEYADATTTALNSIQTLTVTIRPTNAWTVISLETLGGSAHWWGVTIQVDQ